MRIDRRVVVLIFVASCATSGQNKLLKKVYNDQLTYYNSQIEIKADFQSIITFGKQERKSVLKHASQLVESSDFKLLEGFNPAWGNYIGFIWNDQEAYMYRRMSNNSQLVIEKIAIKSEANTYIDPVIISKIDAWDIKFISNLKGQLGVDVIDGYNFIATSVRNGKIETIAFAEFKID